MKENKIGNIIRSQGIWVVFFVLCIGFTIANPRFITGTNLLIMLRQVAVWGIASVGMTFVILLGDIDLATGSIITFVNVLCAYLMVNKGVPMVLAIIITLAAATLIGLLNGFMVSTIGIPALIATFRYCADHLRRTADQRFYGVLQGIRTGEDWSGAGSCYYHDPLLCTGCVYLK